MKANELELISNNKFVLDCPKITLSPELPSTDKKSYTGSGSITQSGTGEFLLKLYCDGVISPIEVRSLFLNTTAGKIIGGSEYYCLSAVDLKGRSWEAKRIFPNIHSGPNPGYLVLGGLNEISYSSNLPKALTKSSVNIGYRGDIDIPCNKDTTVETSVGGERRSKYADFNIAKFQTNGFEFEIKKEKDWLSFCAVTQSRPITNAVITRFTEALQFVLGRTLHWSVMELLQQQTQETRVRASLKNEKESSRIQPPISFRSYDNANNVWNLFGKYFGHVISYPERTWHPLFSLIHSVIESGKASLEAEALTLSVSIEGILKREFSALAMPDEVFKKQVDRALNLIERSELSDSIKERMSGFLGAMLSPRAKDRLFILKDKRFIYKELIESWDKLRNSSTHADSPESVDFQTYLNRCNSALVLFYHLVFLAIGYTGEYTDYSSYDYPMKSFDQIMA